MSKVTLITGGARSGKSTFAEELIREKGEKILYVATAKAIDDEMKDRIKKHQSRRPAHWDTLEQYRGLAAVLPELSRKYNGILLDCVTIMATNLIFDDPVMLKEDVSFEEMLKTEKALVAEINDFIACFPALSCDLILVTNEVGLGLVPEYPLSRFYRDALGRVNQALGKAATEVHFVTCGVPLKIKG
ncbi:MAG TPA: bifunctional adenosylcobinamide kinase/adenosylcobinamide-phosphate guanylyltransferase [Clostridiales bacterium]|nr:bifunctional adenosylcobinamide kinase/adenosylcobinamide-phosphate guanylyltransferase [Clostridiales bacterium]